MSKLLWTIFKYTFALCCLHNLEMGYLYIISTKFIVGAITLTNNTSDRSYTEIDMSVIQNDLDKFNVSHHKKGRWSIYIQWTSLEHSHHFVYFYLYNLNKKLVLTKFSLNFKNLSHLHFYLTHKPLFYFFLHSL